MSALAARRAAAAALAASSPAPPTPQAKSSVSKIKSKSKSSTPARKRSPSPLPAILKLDESEDESESSASSTPPSPKRKRTKQSSPPTSAQRASRPVQPNISPIRRGQLIRERRFSPSAPASEVDGDDSSDAGEDDVLSEDETYEAARDDVDEGRVKWSVQTTPGASSTPGPSRVRTQLPSTTNAPTDTITSDFQPVENENIYNVTEQQLRAAGLLAGGMGAGVIVSLAENENLVLAGMYSLTPIQSSLSLLSTTLSPATEGNEHTSHPIFAPTSHPLPVITPSSSHLSKPPASPFLARLSLPSSFKIRDGRGKLQTVFIVREHRCGLDGLRSGAVPGFSHIWLQEKGTWGLRGVHPVIGSFPSPVYPHITPETWDSALVTLPSGSPSKDEDGASDYQEPESPIIALVKGPKRSGKSTFARAALNTLLRGYERVAWLECDLGQGEFGCGGVVGLWIVDEQQLGPPFCHPAVPVRAYYLGTYTPLTCPDEYLTSIRKLIDYYRYELQYPSEPTPVAASSERISGVVPLVVNTQGWVKGLGEELLRSIELMVEPTDVFDFQPRSLSEDGYDAHAPGGGWTSSPPYTSAQLSYDTTDPYSTSYSAPLDSPSLARRVHILEPAQPSPLQARYTPADFRVLSTITYFHSSLPPTPSGPTHGEVSWDFSNPLSAQRPWEIQLSETDVINRIYFIGEGSEGVLPSDLAIALNGSVVALVEVLDNSDADEFVDGDRPEQLGSVSLGRLYVPGRAPPQEISTLGLALIRAILPLTPTSFKIQLLTPLPPSALKRCSAIIKNGAIELPLPGLLDWINSNPASSSTSGAGGAEEIPFVDNTGIEVVAGERRRFRKNLMRKGM